MQTQKIKLIDDSYYEIPLNSDDLLNHFNNKNNFTKEILHQFNDVDYYKDYISQNDKVILDIGSNVGLFAVHVSPFAERVVGFEPTPSHFTLNKVITSQFPNIEINELAVADKTGETTFNTSNENSTMNSLIPRNGNTFQVKTISVKDIFSKFKIKKANFVKIDIEGSEVITLTDEAINILSKKADKILIEFHVANGIPEYQHRDEFKKKFESLGMNAVSFNNDGLFVSK